jgi:hypothetical protein
MSNSICELATHNILDISKMQKKKIALQYKCKANIFLFICFTNMILNIQLDYWGMFCTWGFSTNLDELHIFVSS